MMKYDSISDKDKKSFETIVNYIAGRIDSAPGWRKDEGWINDNLSLLLEEAIMETRRDDRFMEWALTGKRK